MSIIIFIIVLGVLIFIHELGHFLVAKKAGIRVDEFAIGFPPRLFSFVKGGTRYALNLIPFGGYVKIYGESPEDGADDKNATDSMINKTKGTQALVLVAGIVFNILLAFVILWFLFIRGIFFPAAIVPFVEHPDAARVEYVMEGSIAESAGLQEGDLVIKVTNESIGSVYEKSEIIGALYNEQKETTEVVLLRDNTPLTFRLQAESPDAKFGFSLTDTVFIKDNFFIAGYHAFMMTGHLAKLTTVGLFQFFGELFTGRANFEEIAGPVGIVGLVGKAAENGLNDVLFLTAIISINLAVLNVLPFPALDGGRLAIVAIEAIRRKDLDYKKVAIINLIGFLLLISLMILLTFHDIKNLFN